MTVSTEVPMEPDRAGEQVLSAAELADLDAWWRAANYLSVGQIYLLDYPLLRRDQAVLSRRAAGVQQEKCRCAGTFRPRTAGVSPAAPLS